MGLLKASSELQLIVELALYGYIPLDRRTAYSTGVYSSYDALLAFKKLQGSWNKAEYVSISFPNLSWGRIKSRRMIDGILAVYGKPSDPSELFDTLLLYRIPFLKTESPSIDHFVEHRVTGLLVVQYMWDVKQDLFVLATKHR